MDDLTKSSIDPFRVGDGNITPHDRASSKGIGWQNLPDPTIRSINPFTQARNLSGKMQLDIANDLEVTPLYVMRLEQAVFGRVPERVSQYYTSTLGMPDYWEAGYRTFQRLMRTSAPRPITGKLEMPSPPVDFRRWRITNWPTMSQVGWCKALCVHPASLYAIEKGGQDKVPAEILAALIEAKLMDAEQARVFAGRIRMTAFEVKQRDETYPVIGVN